MDVEIIGAIVGAVLTLVVFGYLLGDIPFLGSLAKLAYRLVLHLFIGAVVGYSFGVVVREVGVVMIVTPLIEDPVRNLTVAVPVVMGLALFFFKSIRRLAYVGNYSLSYLIGVGAAVALLGALVGTLIPQIEATASALRLNALDFQSLVKGLLIFAGTVCALLAFDFTTLHRWRGLARTLGRRVVGVGRWFWVFALGVAFAGALTASLSIFIGRIQYLIEVAERVAEFLGLGV